MSKRVTRLWQDEPEPGPERGRKVLALRPRRAVETWSTSVDDGHVVITHGKNLRPLEARLASALGGSRVIHRHLDEFGSAVWTLCDGQHTVEEIARALEARFHERFEPALPRALKFVQILAEHQLVTIETGPLEPAGGPGAESPTA